MSEVSSHKMSSSAQLRKIKKPIIEKRRRERINDSLNQLKALVLDSLQKDESRYSKMEKADILEMTVRHLKTVQRQQRLLKAAEDRELFTKYRTGFTECAGEVSRYLSSVGENLTGEVQQRLLNHLVQCVHKTHSEAPPTASMTSLPTASMTSLPTASMTSLPTATVTSPPIATPVATLPGALYGHAASSPGCGSRTQSPMSQCSPLPSPSSSSASPTHELSAPKFVVVSPTPVHAQASPSVNKAIPLYVSAPYEQAQLGGDSYQQRAQRHHGNHHHRGESRERYASSPKTADEFPSMYHDHHSAVSRHVISMASSAAIPCVKSEAKLEVRRELECESSAVWRPW